MTCVFSTPRTLSRLFIPFFFIQYIRSVTELRKASESDVLVDISDIRNGVLLYAGLHGPLGSGAIAFLKVRCHYMHFSSNPSPPFYQTPNFALLSNDIPPSPRPCTNPNGRLTLQIINDADITPVTRMLAPHNQDARPPDDVSGWPTSIVLDAFYGCAAVAKWGNKECCDLIRSIMDSHYYDMGGLDADSSNGSDSGEEDHTITADLPRSQAEARDERAARRASEKEGNSQTRKMSDIMDFIVRLWAQPDAGSRHQHEMSNSRTVSCDKVLAWLQVMGPN